MIPLTQHLHQAWFYGIRRENHSPALNTDILQFVAAGRFRNAEVWEIQNGMKAAANRRNTFEALYVLSGLGNWRARPWKSLRFVKRSRQRLRRAAAATCGRKEEQNGDEELTFTWHG